MSIFEPKIVRAIIRHELTNNSELAKFDAAWNKSVSTHAKTWGKDNAHADEKISKAQFDWIGEVLAYVEFLYSRTKLHGNPGSDKKPPSLKLRVPILGPCFAPPGYLQLEKRSALPTIKPEPAYLRPVNVIHPVYSSRLRACPQCGGANILWYGWTSTGPRLVYGVRQPEWAIGYQLRCKDCKTAGREQLTDGDEDAEAIHNSWATTNTEFWQHWEYWQVPRNMPIFFHKCAVTRELLDLILELRLSSMSGGLAENIKQLHLLEYHQAIFEYLESYKKLETCEYNACALEDFSGPWDVDGYSGKSISADLITEILLEYSRRTRQQESSDYLKTLTAITISIDATFKSTKKAAVTSSNGARTTPHRKGGLLSALNEVGQCVDWELCMTQSNAEVEQFLTGLGKRIELHHQMITAALHREAGASGLEHESGSCDCDPDLLANGPSLQEIKAGAPPAKRVKQVTADNCCHIRRAIEKAFPDAAIGLDVHHALQRYQATIIGNTNNPYRMAVMKDLKDAILISGADGEETAKYRTKEEQEIRVEAVYTKWAERGSIWSAASAAVHAAQMLHIKKGCLTRAVQDVASDGSRIEGSHKGWNSIMRSHACGIEVFIALGHDHVLRRNLRIAWSSGKTSSFVMSTYGSHHLRLVNHNAMLWNSLINAKAHRGQKKHNQLACRPEMLIVPSDEQFGLRHSVDAETYDGLIRMKEEDGDDAKPADLLEQLEGHEDRDRSVCEAICGEMHINPKDFCQPAKPTWASLTAPSATTGPGEDDGIIDLTADADNAGDQRECECAASATTAPARPSHECDSASSSAAPAHPSHEHDHAASAATAPACPPLQASRSQAEAARLKRKAEQPVGATADSSSTGGSAAKKVRLAAATAQCRAKAPASTIQQLITQRTTAGRMPIHAFYKTRKPPSRGVPPTAIPDDAAPSGSTPDPESESQPDTSPTISAQTAATVPSAASAEMAAPSTASTDMATTETATPSATSTQVAMPSAVSAQTAALTVRLPAPATPRGLSRSERMWTRFTQINARALVIEEGLEFFVYMEVRAEQQWATYSMNGRKWAAATQTYNERLAQRFSEKNWPTPVFKHPSALSDKLPDVEDMVLKRLISGDFVSNRSKKPGMVPSEKFWKEHCHAVPLLTTAAENGSGGGRDREGKQRQPQTCRRCRTIKYISGVRGVENHQRDYCSDGVRSRLDVPDEPPKWPQPNGIFSLGKNFHVNVFLAAVRAFYEALVLRGDHVSSLSLEQIAFGGFLRDRLFIDGDDVVLFPLYDNLTLQPRVDNLIKYASGKKCLRVDCLSDDDAAGLEALLADGAAAATTTTTAAGAAGGN